MIEETYTYKPKHKRGEIKLNFLIGNCGGCRCCSIYDLPYISPICLICEEATRYFCMTHKLKNSSYVVIKEYYKSEEPRVQKSSTLD